MSSHGIIAARLQCPPVKSKRLCFAARVSLTLSRVCGVSLYGRNFIFLRVLGLRPVGCFPLSFFLLGVCLCLFCKKIVLMAESPRTNRFSTAAIFRTTRRGDNDAHIFSISSSVILPILHEFVICRIYSVHPRKLYIYRRHKFYKHRSEYSVRHSRLRSTLFPFSQPSLD
jgi:hypothetical protein